MTRSEKPKLVNIPEHWRIEFAEENRAVIMTDLRTGKIYVKNSSSYDICYIINVKDGKSGQFVFFMRDLEGWYDINHIRLTKGKMKYIRITGDNWLKYGERHIYDGFMEPIFLRKDLLWISQKYFYDVSTHRIELASCTKKYKIENEVFEYYSSPIAVGERYYELSRLYGLGNKHGIFFLCDYKTMRRLTPYYDSVTNQFFDSSGEVKERLRCAQEILQDKQREYNECRCLTQGYIRSLVISNLLTQPGYFVCQQPKFESIGFPKGVILFPDSEWEVVFSSDCQTVIFTRNVGNKRRTWVIGRTLFKSYYTIVRQVEEDAFDIWGIDEGKHFFFHGRYKYDPIRCCLGLSDFGARVSFEGKKDKCLFDGQFLLAEVGHDHGVGEYAFYTKDTLKKVLPVSDLAIPPGFRGSDSGFIIQHNDEQIPVTPLCYPEAYCAFLVDIRYPYNIVGRVWDNVGGKFVSVNSEKELQALVEANLEQHKVIRRRLYNKRDAVGDFLYGELKLPDKFFEQIS